MNRIHSFIVFIIVLVLFISANGVVAQNRESSIRVWSGLAAPSAEQLLFPQAFQRFWLITNNNAQGASVAVDAAGGIHVGFSAYTSVGGIWPAYYAYCASSCTNPANWATTIVGDLGAWGGYTRLALNPAGHPRLLWFNETSISAPGVYQYAECNTSCANPANWAKVSLTTDTVGPSFSRYFALDQQGRPRYLYTDTDSGHTGTYYVFCDIGCTSAANWFETQIDTAYLLYDFSLAFDTTGEAHMAYRDATNSPDSLWYAKCSANCNNANNWTATSLIDIGSGHAFSLRLDAQNRPRLAFYTGYRGSGDPYNDLLVYAWCNTACTQESNWDNYALGLPADYGADVELALDQQGRPRMAYYVDDGSTSTYGLGYSECTANCEDNSTAVWQDQFVETSDDLDASDPIPIKIGCSISSWLEVGRAPSLALDVAGNPRIGYTAQHFQGGTCAISEDLRLVRFALLGGGSTPPTAPAAVTSTGPVLGVINVSYTFTATVSPITTTQPITYVWQATGLTAQTHTGCGTSDTASFTWPSGATGSKTITVSVTNQAGTARGVRTILISATPIVFSHWVYLPAIRKP